MAPAPPNIKIDITISESIATLHENLIFFETQKNFTNGEALLLTASEDHSYGRPSKTLYPKIAF